MADITQEQFLEAAKNLDKKTIEAYLAQGNDINARTTYDASDFTKVPRPDQLYQSALHLLAAAQPKNKDEEKNQLDLIKLMIDKKLNVNLKDHAAGKTPLHYASNPKVAELLIKNGADVKAADDYGVTPMHMAAYKGNTAVMELLTKELKAKGANVNAPDKRGDTPLHGAAFFGKADAVKWLIEKNGADVNARDDNKETPMHKAAFSTNVDAMIVLLKHGGSLTDKSEWKDGTKETPIKVLEIHLGDKPEKLAEAKEKLREALREQINAKETTPEQREKAMKNLEALGPKDKAEPAMGHGLTANAKAAVRGTPSLSV